MSNGQSAYDAWAPQVRSVLRIVTALLFMQHGAAKLFHVPYQAAFAHLHLASLLGVQGILEFFGGLLLLVGLFSRSIAFLLSGDMAVAFFLVHFRSPRGWLPILNGGDLAVLFSFVYLYLWFAGPGPWSIDAWLRGRRAAAPAATKTASG